MFFLLLETVSYFFVFCFWRRKNRGYLRSRLTILLMSNKTGKKRRKCYVFCFFFEKFTILHSTRKERKKMKDYRALMIGPAKRYELLRDLEEGSVDVVFCVEDMGYTERRTPLPAYY